MKPYYKLIKEYIETAITSDTEKTNPKEAYTEIAKYFDSAANHAFNKQQIPDNQARFADWLQGIPLSIAFANWEILELAVKWGSLPENASEKQEDKIIENYWLFMACNMGKFARRLGVDLF